MSERTRLPTTRQGRTKRIHLHAATGNLKIYITVGEYPDGTPGEIFLRADKAGSTISGLLDALSITASIALQYGAPLDTLVDKWQRLQFAPSGTTDDPEMKRVSSIVDAVARWLALRYVRPEAGGEVA